MDRSRAARARQERRIGYDTVADHNSETNRLPQRKSSRDITSTLGSTDSTPSKLDVRFLTYTPHRAWTFDGLLEG